MDKGIMNKTNWIIIVDDDAMNLKVAETVLDNSGMKATGLKSGQELMDFLDEGNMPDLILLDVLMPGMDGFETLKRLKSFEKERGITERPVIFLTADDNNETEMRGFAEGAFDFIRKPFDATVLVRRIQNAIENFRRMQELSRDATMDKLTRLLNKDSVTRQLEETCAETGGALLVIDIDSFKLVNDIYGHDAGDRVLEGFAWILRKQFRMQDIVGRIGGDEFIAFLKDASDREGVVRAGRRLNERLRTLAFNLLGSEMNIPLGVSAGAVLFTAGGDYHELFHKADKTLLKVKQNGKHDCMVWQEWEADSVNGEVSGEGIKRLELVLDERNVDNRALWMGQEVFGQVYRYMLRYFKRYEERAYKVLFSVEPEAVSPKLSGEELAAFVTKFGETLQNSLRNSDIMMQCGPESFFLILPTVPSEDITKVIGRILSRWRTVKGSEKMKVSFETEAIVPEPTPPRRSGGAGSAS